MAAGRKTGGRTKGTPNKTTAALKDAILTAAREAGEQLADAADIQITDGTVYWLTALAKSNDSAFATLLGKVLPLTLAGDEKNPLALTLIERRIVKADP